jgi:uncharacterized protein involved in exopolysaccharide biosynthesis
MPTPETSLPPPPPPEPDDEISLLDLVLTIAENLRLLILGPLAMGLVALAYSYTITPTFTATTLLLPPQQQQSASSILTQQLGGLGSLVGTTGTGLRNPNDQYVSLLKSRTIGDRLIERFQLRQRYKVEFMHYARLKLDANTRVSVSKDGLIKVEFDDKDPDFAAEVVNAYVEELTGLLKSLAVTEAQKRRIFFEKLLAETRDKLASAQKSLAVTGVNSSALRSSPEATVTPLAQLQARIREQEVRLGVMRGYLAESSVEFRRTQDELTALRSQVQKFGQISPPVTGDSDYIARFREFKYQETLFDLFSRQYEIARVDESREGAVIQVVDRGIPPELKTKPLKALIAILTTLTTGFLLLIFVFVRQALRRASVDEKLARKIQTLRHYLNIASYFRR